MTHELKPSVRLGIIGLGIIGRAHALNASSGEIPGLRLSGFHDAAGSMDNAFPGVESFATLQDMIHSGRIDAVIIATPHFSHTSLGIDCLEGGLHVLVEKPASVHAADCQRLLEAQKDPRQVFGIVFNQRTNPLYLKLREWISSGELGKILRVNWTISDWFRPDSYYASSKWRATWAGEGGGVLLNQAHHQLDIWQWLFGMPAKVRAFCHNGKYHDIEVEDDVTAYMEYADGMTGTFITSTGEAPGVNRLEISAERGRVIVEEGSIQWKRNKVDSTTFIKECPEYFDKPETEDRQYAFETKGEQHLGILRNFIEAIRNGEPLIAPGREGIRAVELANAMIHSSDTGRTIELPLDAKAYEAHLLEKIANSRMP
jgi:predicted dehydrogenase